MAEEIMRGFTITINVQSRSERSTADIFKEVQSILDNLNFDKNVYAKVEVRMLPTSISL